MVNQIIQLSGEKVKGPEFDVPHLLSQMSRATATNLIVEDCRNAIWPIKVSQRDQVLMPGAGTAMESYKDRSRRLFKAAKNLIPRLAWLPSIRHLESDLAFAYRVFRHGEEG